MEGLTIVAFLYWVGELVNWIFAAGGEERVVFCLGMGT